MFRHAGRLLVGLCLVVVMMVGYVQPVTAQDPTCDSSFGTRVPVLLVHGFDSNPGMWSEGNPSMLSVLRTLKGVRVVAPFNYKDNHFDWVTNKNIGPKLARTIHCLAQTSRREGGAGKVIVVGHSMGGLATRFAANQPIDGGKIADEIGLVITLGTPHLGSPMATIFGDLPRAYCRLLVNEQDVEKRMREVRLCWESEALTELMGGSDGLAELPSFPSGLPVRAIAGDMTVYYQYFDSMPHVGLQGDGVVPVISATAEFTNTGRGDGRYVFACDLRHYDVYGLSKLVPGVHGGQCMHLEMYKTSYIQESVVVGIKEYLASVRPALVPAPDASHIVGGKTLTILDRLVVPQVSGWQLSFAKPGKFVNYSDDTHCDEQQDACPHIHFINIGPGMTGDDLIAMWTDGRSPCTSGTTRSVEGPVDVAVGGVSAQIFRQYCGDIPRYAWIIPDKALYVGTDERVDVGVLEHALENVTWR